jgi:hypothetical protein
MRTNADEALEIVLADPVAAIATASAKDAHTIALYTRPNVIGLGVGARIRGGRVQPEIAIKVYVTRKVPPALLRPEMRVPTHIEQDGVRFPVDVEDSRMPALTAYIARNRPLRGGSSIAPVGQGFGTLGCCVTLDDQQTYILSNNHVLAALNANPIGTRIVQPSQAHGGVSPGDEIASLSAFVPLDTGTFTVLDSSGNPVAVQNPNFVDCALARVDANGFDRADREIHWLGYPSLAPPDTSSLPLGPLWPLGRMVHMMGTTSEYLTGRVLSLWDDRIFTAGTSLLRFVAQLRISAPVRGGDSGSLFLDQESNIPAALLFGGDGVSDAFATPIGRVLNALGIPRV